MDSRLDILASAGMVGMDAETALRAYDAHNELGISHSADSARVAAVLERVDLDPVGIMAEWPDALDDPAVPVIRALCESLIAAREKADRLAAENLGLAIKARGLRRDMDRMRASTQPLPDGR